MTKEERFKFFDHLKQIAIENHKRLIEAANSYENGAAAASDIGKDLDYITWGIIMADLLATANIRKFMFLKIKMDEFLPAILHNELSAECTCGNCQEDKQDLH